MDGVPTEAEIKALTRLLRIAHRLETNRPTNPEDGLWYEFKEALYEYAVEHNR